MTDTIFMTTPSYPADHIGEGLKKAREFRGLSLKDCSSLLGIPTNKLLNYEKGKYVPSLPELEALSYIYSVPLMALFFPEKYPDLFKIPNSEQLMQLLKIRQNITATTLQLAFDKTGKTLKEISKLSGLALPKLKRYLSAESEIPINDLQKLANALNLELNSLLDNESPIGQWQELQRRKIAYAELPENARDFLNKKENWPYIEVIEKMKEVDPEKLESIADSIRLLAGLSRTNQNTQE